MTSIADGSVIIQTSSRSVPSTPSWFGEVALIVEHLRKQGVLDAICERVRFARRRFPRDAQRAVLLQVKWLQIGLYCIPGFDTKVEPLPGRESATEEERQWR